MRSRLTLLALLFQTAVSVAAPLPSLNSRAEPAKQDDSSSELVFAHQLVGVSSQVVEQYVRPVVRTDLVYASLAGLYLAARLPAPERLRADVAAAASDQALIELVRRVRVDVGNAEILNGPNALLICCQAMARSLDPYSSVGTAEENRRTLGLEQEGTGVGLEVMEHVKGTSPVIVKAVHPGSPAQRAGLRPDDRITLLDGRPVQEWTDEEVVQRLTQPPFQGDLLDGSSQPTPPVALTFERPGQCQLNILTLPVELYSPEYVVGVVRQEDQTWNYLVDPKERIAYIRLTALGKGSPGALAEVVSHLHEEGLSGLILDLRWCPGGYLLQAVDVVNLFLRDGLVATVKMRNADDQVYRCKPGGSFVDFPMLVLVNGETSGGAEMIAAALQDHHRAVVAGQRTLGKASVQTPIHLGVSQAGMKLTSGTFQRPSGKNLHRFPESLDGDDWGVHPDAGLDFRVSVELSRQLKQWWLLQTLRPGGSSERLPLDDPTADPQRQAALEELREIITRSTVRAAAK